MVNVNFSMFLDRSNVFVALDRKRKGVLSRTGKFSMTTMRRLMRKAPKKKRLVRAIDDEGNEILRDARGRLHSRDGRLLPKSHAAKIVRQQYETNASPPGKPPYSREGSLRGNIWFGFDPSSESVVTGPTAFKSDTKPSGGKTVPELLDDGGDATALKPGGGNIRTEYKPRPFTPPTFEKGERYFRDQIEATPLK